MAPRRRGGLPTRPRQGPVRPNLLVLVEGSKTEPSYLLPLVRHLRDSVIIEVDDRGAAPLTLVQRAVARKREGDQESRRQRGRAYDGIWCLFDRDEHPNIPEAFELAERHGIQVAMSNPCIELWFVLHFEDRAAFVTRQDAQRRAEHHLGCRKVLDEVATSKLHTKSAFEAARRRAEALEKKHEGDGSPRRSNPSSDVWRFIDHVQAFRASGP